MGIVYLEATKKKIPGPLEVYAALWIKAGEDADTMNEGLEKIFTKGEESKEVKGNITTPIAWSYIWKRGRGANTKKKDRTKTIVHAETEVILIVIVKERN